MPQKNCFFSIISMMISLSINAQNSMEAKGCRPIINTNLPQFIIGYGSLMKEESKKEGSTNVGENIPIYLTGFERGWIEHSTDTRFGTTYLGAVKKENARMNAVYFSLKVAKEIHHYDQREDTYCRVNVSKKQMQSLQGKPIPQGQYWIYTTLSKEAIPSPQYPIVQSYVDIFLSGCFELEKKYQLHDFAKDCINTTINWSRSWVNDRVYPRTAIDNIPYVTEVDSLILKTLPQFYNLIKIE